MRMGILISESGSESNLKSVFSNVGFAGSDDDDVADDADDGVIFRLQAKSPMTNIMSNKTKLFFFIEKEMPHD